MKIQAFTFNPFATNTYVVASEGEAVVVDAASHTPAEHAQIRRYVEAEGLAVRHLLLTHAHIDHVFGCAALADAFGLGWSLHPDDQPILSYAAEQARYFGVQLDEAPPRPAHALRAGSTIRFGARAWQVLHVPGHAPGHVAFYDAAAGVVFAGDVLFRGSIGRTDLPLGDLPTLLRSIETQILTLPDATRVLPGHGPETTVAHERRHNPYLGDQ